MQVWLSVAWMKSPAFWLLRTGAGAALVAGAILAVIVGTVIVAQTLYSSTKEHLYEFATLRAMGAANTYIHKVIVCQALIDTIIGLAIAGLIKIAIVRMTATSVIQIASTPKPGDDPVWLDPRDGYRLGARLDCAGRSRRSRNRADPMTAPVIEAANVSKVYGSGPARVEALRDVNLTVRTGELTVLIGPSGRRKNHITLDPWLHARAVGRSCARSSRGDSIVGVRAGNNSRPSGAAISGLCSSPIICSRRSRRPKTCSLLSMCAARAGQKAVAKAEEMLAGVGLSSKLNPFPRQLSGGEQQRVAIARAIVADPSIVLADEPTAALDLVNGHAIMTILSAIAKQRDRAVLVVTHDARLFGFSDRIIHIEDGLLTREEPCNPDAANAAARGGSTRLLSPDLRKIKPQQAACGNPEDHSVRRSEP